MRNRDWIVGAVASAFVSLVLSGCGSPTPESCLLAERQYEQITSEQIVELQRIKDAISACEQCNEEINAKKLVDSQAVSRSAA